MKNTIINLVLIITSFNLWSQKVQLSKADKLYEKYAYVDAIKTYERIFEKGVKNPEMLKKLGNAYYFKADLEKAAKWYGELFSITEDLDPEYFYRYAQSLKSIQNYDMADKIMEKFIAKNENDTRGNLLLSQKNYREIIKQNSGRYILKNANINSKYSDYGGANYNNKLVFASARDSGNVSRARHSWTGEKNTDLFIVDTTSENKSRKPIFFDKTINTRYNESTAIFSKDGKTVYFTRNNYLKRKRKDKEGTMLLKIYKATLVENKWTNIKELPFNSNEYSVAHPTLSIDEKTLYFASNMPGTLGQSDIFKVTINGESYGTPENLGPNINTAGRETFPYFSDENELFFASDGHPGLGGLDVFASKIEPDGSFSNSINVGEPINSPRDDFSYLINNNTHVGYVSSNRKGGNGNDDIYKFREIKKLQYKCTNELAGVVIDKDTKEPIEAASVVLFDKEHKTISEIVTNKEGKFDFGFVDCGIFIFIKTSKAEYFTNEKQEQISSEIGKKFVSIELERSEIKLAVGDNLAKAFGIKDIYFDLDKFNIRKDASDELVKILDVLEQYPTMELDIRSHTDCRQSANYNLILSDKRAKSTVEWLVSNGVNKNRLQSHGYGESKLINNCMCEPTNDSNCSEDEHQTNRRSEFIITKL